MVEREPITTSVLIVGAGPVGLVTSALLSRRGVPNLVIDARNRVGAHPRARSVNVRSSEILHQLGLTEQLENISLPVSWTRRMLWTDQLLSDTAISTPWLQDPDALDRPEGNQDYLAKHSPRRFFFSSQEMIDVVLHDCAAESDAAEIRLSNRLVSLEDHGTSVEAVVRDLATDDEYTVRANWLIAADGAYSFVRDEVGIQLLGQRNINKYMNIQLRCNFNSLTDGERAVQFMVIGDAPGVLCPLNTADRWQAQISLPPETDTDQNWPTERVEAYVRSMVGTAAGKEVDVEILSKTTWGVSSTIAESYRSGRVLLVGDAAHQVPPFGGFGMNSGIQDAHNLAWKLAAVEAGWAGPGLVDTYGAERQDAMREILAGVTPNAAVSAAVFRSSDSDEQRRLIEGRPEFGQFLGLELGQCYRHGAVVDAGSDEPAELSSHDISHHHPSAAAGHRAPHVWLTGADGGRISTVDLCADDFVLLCGEDGASWVDAAGTVGPQLGIPLRAYTIGAHGDVRDVDGQFTEVFGLSSTGCVLTRPDGYVAFRSENAVENPTDRLHEVLAHILDRPAQADRNGDAGARPSVATDHDMEV